jgi:hypothetical protein
MKLIILLTFLFFTIAASAQVANRPSGAATQMETTAETIFDASTFRLIATRNDVQLFLEANHSHEVVVKVVSLVGQEVISKSMMLQPGTNELNLPFGRTLNEGLYFVMIAINNEIFSRKFMVAG